MRSIKVKDKWSTSATLKAITVLMFVGLFLVVALYKKGSSSSLEMPRLDHGIAKIYPFAQPRGASYGIATFIGADGWAVTALGCLPGERDFSARYSVPAEGEGDDNNVLVATGQVIQRDTSSGLALLELHLQDSYRPVPFPKGVGEVTAMQDYFIACSQPLSKVLPEFYPARYKAWCPAVAEKWMFLQATVCSDCYIGCPVLDKEGQLVAIVVGSVQNGHVTFSRDISSTTGLSMLAARLVGPELEGGVLAH